MKCLPALSKQILPSDGFYLTVIIFSSTAAGGIYVVVVPLVEQTLLTIP